MSNQNRVIITECPRDAMQGWPRLIATEQKIRYLNVLMRVGFDVLDFGSFVSPKAVPQMADTDEVLKGLEKRGGTQLLAIIVNERGAERALAYPQIDLLGFPFSLSETFQQRNAHQTMQQALEQVKHIQAMLEGTQAQMLIYLSMGFGNPYGDPYHEDWVYAWIDRLAALGIRYFALADTVALAHPDLIRRIFQRVLPAFPELHIGAHLHVTPHNWQQNLQAAFESGCRRFDSALGGYGGCPMAADQLTGNLATEQLIEYLKNQSVPLSIHQEWLQKARQMVAEIFV
ncbi:hydroxymethylglutaryl-CoA lyase [Thermoflavifilum thermophilum]|uniref:Hydroxymethylglutaryl-CoA lyase n=1 Tax=Thermoflavifilum thermophilum TaxID=1393122 RepID=A0A1I7NJH7_9BACT|nr:hydroxymethylglutaryl-CoA lyase [Thermoflavifilum thermophilum]SFV34831.1 hydroxymethylglutaryl-CoA lyase [Thermoflavifilum thermophilum]